MPADLTGVPDHGVPLALADLHKSMTVGDTVEVAGIEGALPDPERRRDVVVGAGFAVVRSSSPVGDEAPASAAERHRTDRSPVLHPNELDAVERDLGQGRTGRGLVLRRDRCLADTVGAGMRLLVCGLNPSPWAADTGVGFGRPGNRFWPAALAAGLASADRDPRRALIGDRVGMTDLVKRVTARAAEVGRSEYRAGLARVQRLCEWLRPEAVCMVGLSGWRAAADSSASAGWQDRRLGPAPVYVMPSTSGLNARVGLEDLTQHLRTALAGPAAEQPLVP